MDRRSTKDLARRSRADGFGRRPRRRLLSKKTSEARERVQNKTRYRHGQLVSSIVQALDRTLSSVNAR